MRFRRTVQIRITAAAFVTLALLALAAAIPLSSAAQQSVGQLSNRLDSSRAQAQRLSGSIGNLNNLISHLDGQISLVQSREAAVSSQLASDRAALAGVERSLARERALLVVLRARLARARMVLSRQLVSSYEGDKPDLVRVVLDANGFTDLLEKIDFLHRAEQQQQTIIQFTRRAKAQADGAAVRLTKLQDSERRITQATALQAAALAGMNTLLQSKQSALQQARAAQQTALAAARARGSQLQSAIARLQAQQAAAQRPRSSRRLRRLPRLPRPRRSPGPRLRSAPRAAGRFRTRSCCVNPAARTCHPTVRAHRATTRSSRRPGARSAAAVRPRIWPASPSRTPSRRGSGTAAPARRIGSAPASSGSISHGRPAGAIGRPSVVFLNRHRALSRWRSPPSSVPSEV
jgi:septal ring factor EnvC (AmiA/AmiB activator)